MAKLVRQQIIISGVGGQGVLFVTRLLAEAAISRGIPVLTSETHGMAQRGGTVLSHLKVGDYASPLIRPAQADGLLILKSENVAQHGAFLRAGGWAVVNTADRGGPAGPISADSIDADSLARKIGNPKAVNLIVLGYALARAEGTAGAHARLFCSMAEIRAILQERFGGTMLNASLKALEAGFNESVQ